MGLAFWLILVPDVVSSDIESGQLAVPEMVVIKPGRYVMGNQARDGYADERPAHLVVFDYSFEISRYEITFDQYDAFAKATDRDMPHDQGWGRRNRPVINVSWHDAVDYTRWLSHETGNVYRLPSESEWEYAARSGSELPYWWGLESSGREGHFRFSMCDSITSERSCPVNTLPVGSFPPSTNGLHDTAGNVEEWVLDCYQDNYIDAPDNGSARQSCDYQLGVVRGGGWRSESHRVRTSARNDFSFNERSASIGFRIVKELETVESQD